jgi:tetratricopeptide (TPR) repeat protein
MRAAARTALLLAAGLLLVATASASAGDSQGSRYYESRMAKLAKAAAARIWDVAAKARSASLYRFARDSARRVLDLDPDNVQARQFLGYVKRGDEWEMDLAQSGKLPTENVQAPVGPKLADAETTWRAAAAKADLDIAALYSQLGDECANKGFRGEADKAYATALSMDADNAAAHRGLGHVKLGEGFWVTSQASRALEVDRVAKPRVEPSRYEELLGASFNKAESGHFRVESASDQTAIAAFLDSAERALAAYLADLGLPPDTKPFPMTPLFCVLSDDDQWDRWINRIVPSQLQGFNRARIVHWSRERWAGAVRNWDAATDVVRRDVVAHTTVHMLNTALWEMPQGCWLDEALAHRYPMLVRGESWTYCLAPTKSDYAAPGQERVWTNSALWRSHLKDMVGKGDDPALRTIVLKSSFELPILASVKAWSVVDFLMRKDRAQFVRMLKDVKSERDLVGLLETRYGKDVESLDDEWRRWVLGTY